MQWLLDNWVLVLFGGGMIAMHLFGHGHGGHSGHSGDGSTGESASSKSRSGGQPSEEERRHDS